MRSISLNLFFIASVLANKSTIYPSVDLNESSQQHNSHTTIVESTSKFNNIWYRDILQILCDTNSPYSEDSRYIDQRTLLRQSCTREKFYSTTDGDGSINPVTLLRQYWYNLDRLQSMEPIVSERPVSRISVEKQKEEIPVIFNRRSLVNIQIVTQNSNQQSNENNTFRVIIPNKNQGKKVKSKRKQNKMKPTKKSPHAKDTSRGRNKKHKK